MTDWNMSGIGGFRFVDGKNAPEQIQIHSATEKS